MRIFAASGSNFHSRIAAVARVPNTSGIAEMSQIPPTSPSLFGFELLHGLRVADQKNFNWKFGKLGIAKYQGADELVEMLEFFEAWPVPRRPTTVQCRFPS